MTSAKAILLKTIPYILVKLALGGISVAASVIILALWIGFGIETGGFVSVLLFVLWMLVTTAVTYLLMHNAGYQIKAGHIAVAAEAAGANRVPYSMVSWGNRHVKELYPNRDSYFTMKRRVSRSIREVQSCFGRSDIRTASVTGTALTPLLTEPLLLRFMRYLDGCCIGWIFLRRKQNMYKSAADSVILYAKNRRVLLRNAIKVMLKSLICAGAVLLVIFLPLGIIFKANGLHIMFALWIAVLCAWAVKYAVLDSYIMIRTMTNYMKSARNTTLSMDMAEEYCRMSETFKRMWKKAFPNAR
ncbi:MAG: hypothetical protein IKM02_05510 [Clostridia bacterium]|nr:hypothetical protein [Clostridia bacterium]